MLSPLRSPLAILCIVAVLLGVYLRTMRDQLDVARRVSRDDWRGVRDVAGALLTGKRRASGTVVDHASVVLGVAHLVLGDLAAARSTLEDALQRGLPAPLQAMAQRQLASVERTEGSTGAALDRLARPDAVASPDDEWAIALQRAEVHLGDGDAEAAVREARCSADGVTALLARAHTSAMRTAWSADLRQAQCSLVRALIEQGDVDGAGAVWDGGMTEFSDDKPYVRGQLAETGARLAHARGDLATAGDLASVAWGHYQQVGAAIDATRAEVLQARVARDTGQLDAAEEALRRLGALGHLREVDQARREIEGLG